MILVCIEKISFELTNGISFGKDKQQQQQQPIAWMNDQTKEK